MSLDLKNRTSASPATGPQMIDTRLALVAILAVLLLASPLAVGAQPANVPRIGMLMPVPADVAAPNIDAFRQGLRDLGYVEGRNIRVEYRYAQGDAKLLPDLAPPSWSGSRLTSS